MTGYEILLEAFKDCGLKETKNGFKCRCPAHDDHDPSLHISEGNNGKPLIKCFAGCDPEDILTAKGLTWSMVLGGSESRSTANPTSQKTGFDTFEQTVKWLEQTLMKQLANVYYYRVNEQEIFRVLRFEKEGQEKKFRPVHQKNGKWIIGDPPGPLPLYNVDSINGLSRVFVVEGEKCAEVAISIGLPVVTSAHGSQSANLSDWTPLSDKEVILIPDNNRPGRKYVDDVKNILHKLNSETTVKIVALPNLAEDEDIFDFIERRDSVESKTLCEAINTMADTAEVESIKTNVKFEQDIYRSFPVDALPNQVGDIVNQAAEAIGCDPSYIALPLLGAFAAAIGTTREIVLKDSWSEPAILWTVIVGESGTKKSPALDFAVKPVIDQQLRSFKDHEGALQDYRTQQLIFKQEMKKWERNCQGDPPIEPVKPMPQRFWTNDVTIEALAELLKDQPRGLLAYRDELAAWLGSFGEYKGRNSGDAAKWLQIHGARPLLVDRKSGEPINVIRAAVSIAGGIQPGILRRFIGLEYRENGLLARLLLAMPPRKVSKWTHTGIPQEYCVVLSSIFTMLYDLTSDQDENGEPCPRLIGLTTKARQAWQEYFNEHADEQIELTGDLAAAWSKLEGYTARLALVIHCVRVAIGEELDQVDASSIRAGVTLSRWFGYEARRVYALLDEGPDQQQRRELIELIERKGGSITPRELMRGCSRYRANADTAEAALEELVADGLAKWVAEPPGTKGGKPSKKVTLRAYDSSDSDNTTADSL